MTRILTILATPLLALGQVANVEMTKPALGYLYDASRQSLRTIEGVPGAVVISEPMALDGALAEADVSPNRRYALARLDGQERLVIVRLDHGLGATRQSNIPAGSVFFSPDGETVAVATDERIQIWTALSTEAKLLAELPRAAGRLAVSDDGTSLVAIDSGVLASLSSDGAAKIGEGILDAAYLPQSHDLIVARAGGIARISKVSSEPVEELIAEAGVQRLAISADARVAAGWDGGGSLTVVQLQTGSLVRFEAPAGIEGIWRAAGDAIFQLNRTDSPSTWLLDAGSGEPRLSAATREVGQ